jgi:hypothetical protein
MPKIHTRPVCRLFVLLARDAPLGVIFRRSPARLTQLILWHTDTDTFEPGDRHIGTLYTERSDLSPDGKLLNYTARRRNKGLPDTWTALSKPPWLTPLALWPNFGTYYGGGLFTSNTQVQVNWCPPPVPTEISWAEDAPPDDLDFRYDRSFWDHQLHAFTRLERSGWKASEPYPFGSAPLYRLQPDGSYTVEATDPSCLLLPFLHSVYTKAKPHGSLSLVFTATHYYSGGAVGNDSLVYQVQDTQRKTTTPLPGVIWADWDQRGRLVYAQDGKLFTASIGASGQLDPQVIADFTPLDKKRALAPKSAGQW